MIPFGLDEGTWGLVVMAAFGLGMLVTHKGPLARWLREAEERECGDDRGEAR